METPRHVHILWTNDNPVTAEKMVFMYGLNSLKHGWWDNVTIIVWGATAALVAQDANIQKRLKELMAGGVAVSACKACAQELGIVDPLLNLGLELKYWGQLLTELLQSGAPMLTI